MHTHPTNPRVRAWTDRRVPAYTPPLRVLIVDDNKNGAEALAAYLSFESMECRVALGGAQAIRMGAVWLPDVIIMDISMPELNGFDATFALRRDLRTGSILIIAFTALDEDEVFRNLSHAMFDGYCQKGQPPTVLVTLINIFLDKH